jgi:zinc transporter ZupT
VPVTSKEPMPRGRATLSASSWSAVALACALSSLAGYSLLNGASVQTIAFVLAFVGGAILTMLAAEMMPEALNSAGPSWAS